MSSSTKPVIADRKFIPIDTDKIRQLRESLKLSQEKAAKRAGLYGRQKWNDIERGRTTNLTIETLDRIAAALGVRARDLLK